MDEVASSAMLEAAFDWLCKHRVDYSGNADVWNVRFHWSEIKLQLQHNLLEGDYRFSPLRRVQAHGEWIELWAALDALVLKALAMVVLNRRLDFPRSCYHVPGKDCEEKRGAKAAVRHICSRLPENQFVFRSDVKNYYASIDHAVLLALVRDRIDDRRVMDLVAQYLKREGYLGENQYPVVGGQRRHLAGEFDSHRKSGPRRRCRRRRQYLIVNYWAYLSAPQFCLTL
jgi:hypothetical protein